MLTAGPGGAPGGGTDIVVAVQGAETAGLDQYLGGPAADLLAACQATGKAGEVTPIAVWLGGRPHRLSFPGLGGGSVADLRKAGTALGGRSPGPALLLLDRGQQAVAQRQQQRHQPLVLPDRLDHLPDR